jgi:hypothetical protein
VLDFQTVVVRVIIAGTLILGIGAVGLYFVFRAFGGKSESRPVLLLGALVLFIASCSVLLYIVSR